jgi:DNA-binding transcriptional ArsR family regulator
VADKVQRVSGLTALRRHARLWRDRLLASPGFQRWSLRCPLTRPIARRQARALFDVCAGFVYSQVLYACVRLELFRRLADGPRSVDELAESTGVPAAEMRRLLQAAAGLDLVEHRDEADYGLGPLGAALRGNPAIAAMVDHHHLLYADLVDPLALLRGEMEQTHLGRYWGYAGHASPAQLDSSEVASYTGLMAASQSLIADQVIEAVALSRHRRRRYRRRRWPSGHRGFASLPRAAGNRGRFAGGRARGRAALHRRWPGRACRCRRGGLLPRSVAERRRSCCPGARSPRPRRCGC